MNSGLLNAKMNGEVIETDDSSACKIFDEKP